MLKRLIVLAILVGVVSLAAAACGGGEKLAPTPGRPSPAPPPPAPAPAAPGVTTPAQPGAQPGGTSITVKQQDPGGGSAKYQFDPSALTFKVGETANITLAGGTEFHTFTVDELKIDQSVNPGATATFSFTFDKAGTFKLICIPHESVGMVGTITVQ